MTVKHLIDLPPEAKLQTQCGLTADADLDEVMTFDTQDTDCVKCLRIAVMKLQLNWEHLRA